MQVGASEYKNILDAFRKIIGAEGWRALYKGLSANYVKGVISSGISFTLNDFLKAQFEGK